MAFRGTELAPSDWELRDPGFVDLRLYDDDGQALIPVMLFKPVTDRRSTAWETARSVWMDLRPHANVLDALEVSGTAVVLRYAALHWRPYPLVGGENLRRVASWGVQLADALLVATEDLPDFRLGWLTNPFLKVDLGGHVRVGFLAASPEIPASTTYMPPELRTSWPVANERSLVYVVGAALRQLWDPEPAEDWPVARIIRRATSRNPMTRFATLSELRDEFVACSNATDIRRGARFAAWTAAETGVGMLQLHRPASLYFEKALGLDAWCELATWARHASILVTRTKPVSPLKWFLTWDEVEPEARALEATRRFRDALERYYTVNSVSAPGGALYIAIARCHLELGDSGHALDYARRAAAIEPGLKEAVVIERRALLARSEYAEVLSRDRAEDLDDVEALYLRGRALLGLRRLVEARDAFDAVIAQAPKRIDAMLLRRETDRMLLGVRATVGTHDTAPVKDRLAAIRAMVIEGRTADAIEELAKPEHAGDPVARLLLADSLLTAQRPDEALAVYVRVAQLGDPHREPAVVGTAFALLGLGRSEEALAMFEQAASSWPANLDALEGLAQALEAQGRADDAEVIHRRAALARAARSDLRLGIM